MSVLILGLPGTGKSTLAHQLHDMLKGSVHLNADVARATISRDLGFSVADRIAHAHRMKATADLLELQGVLPILDFVCPLHQTQDLFPTSMVVWMDTLKQSRFSDTNAVFEPPQRITMHVTDWDQLDEVALKQLVQDIQREHEARLTKARYYWRTTCSSYRKN